MAGLRINLDADRVFPRVRSPDTLLCQTKAMVIPRYPSLDAVLRDTTGLGHRRRSAQQDGKQSNKQKARARGSPKHVHV